MIAARSLRRARYVAAATLVICAVGALAGEGPSALAANNSGSGSSFTRSETIERTFVENGASTVIDKRHFTVHVSQTKDLRDRQEITVNWSGAHPTGGVQPDPNSSNAAEEQYPVVLMMCRGVSSTSAPAAKQISPSTCYTQTPFERVQSDAAFDFPPYRIDQYASVANRALRVGVPAKLSAACVNDGADTGVQHWIPFVAASGRTFGYGPLGCAGLPPEASLLNPTQPSNTTYAVTQLNGKGSANFVITTNETNASLGCSSSVPCSLVVIPIMGISCDPVAFGLPAADQPPTAAVEQEAATDCETKSLNAGSTTGNQTSALAISGELWWSASNWRNRIAVPLTFAAPDDVCTLVNSRAPQDIYGSPLLAQATTQWSPHFCTNSHLFNLEHVITSEPEAKNLLAQGSISAAFQGVPPPTKFTKPVVQAPTALTGFAVVYDIDTAKGTQYVHLRLDARLLAKLLTESYPANPDVKSTYKPLENNPLDLAEDPEFKALNPGKVSEAFDNEPAATILTLSSDSDVTTALTTYINDDPEARAWLNGKPDPWGMRVNPAYKGIKLPVSSFPLLDTYIPTKLYAGNPCQRQSPVAYLPLVASPVESQATISLDMQFAIPTSQTGCINVGTAAQETAALAREEPGERFLLGITSLADAKRYDLSQAELETQGGSTGSAQFSSAAGRTFAGPTQAGLLSGARSLVFDKALGTWVLPYSKLRHSALGKTAYPGTMLISTDAPTSGLTKPTADDLSKFLSFVAGPGQVSGFGNGQIPPGYLPLTAADGLGNEVAYTRAAATAVAAQKGQIPTATGQLRKAPRGNPTPNPTATSGTTGPGQPTGPGTVPSVTTPSPGASSPSVAPPTTVSTAGPAGRTAALAADGWASKAFPIAGVVILAAMVALGGMGLAHRGRFW